MRRRPQVFLIFSVNQSGHFQGFARMETPIHGHRSAWTNQMSYGGTFGVQWECLCDLPFGRTLHLHNPWNEDKPVKIARDGQARYSPYRRSAGWRDASAAALGGTLSTAAPCLVSYRSCSPTSASSSSPCSRRADRLTLSLCSLRPPTRPHGQAS